jgi:hypothetical protein
MACIFSFAQAPFSNLGNGPGIRKAKALIALLAKRFIFFGAMHLFPFLCALSQVRGIPKN